MKFTRADKFRVGHNRVIVVEADSLAALANTVRHDMERDNNIEFVLIREGDALASDPVIWDSREVPVFYEDILEAAMKQADVELGHLDPGLPNYQNVQSMLDTVYYEQPMRDRSTIWTHTPVPVDFPLAAVNARFEQRAMSVLGDWDEPVNLQKWDGTLPDEIRTRYDSEFTDGRYVEYGVRQSWMMYLDCALQHYALQKLLTRV